MQVHMYVLQRARNKGQPYASTTPEMQTTCKKTARTNLHGDLVINGGSVHVCSCLADRDLGPAGVNKAKDCLCFAGHRHKAGACNIKSAWLHTQYEVCVLYIQCALEPRAHTHTVDGGRVTCTHASHPGQVHSPRKSKRSRTPTLTAHAGRAICARASGPRWPSAARCPPCAGGRRRCRACLFTGTQVGSKLLGRWLHVTPA